MKNNNHQKPQYPSSTSINEVSQVSKASIVEKAVKIYSDQFKHDFRCQLATEINELVVNADSWIFEGLSLDPTALLSGKRNPQLIVVGDPSTDVSMSLNHSVTNNSSTFPSSPTSSSVPVSSSAPSGLYLPSVPVEETADIDSNFAEAEDDDLSFS